MASFQVAAGYHADSDADDEFERSVMTSPTHMDADSDTSTEPQSEGHTPTTYGANLDDRERPDTEIIEWNPADCAQFLASLGLRQYCDLVLEHEIDGEALVKLNHEELKEMGINSVGHRLTILKNVYDIKLEEDIPIDADDYVPLSAEQNPQHDMATKDDIHRLTTAILKLRDDRIAQVEAQLTKLADDYRRLRLELLPVFKMAKERSEPLPYRPHDQTLASPETQESAASPPVVTETEKPQNSLTRKFSKRLGLSSSTPKNHSPTHLPGIIHEGRTLTEPSSLQPSAAANAASNSLTAGMSGGTATHHSPSLGTIPSPTSPLPYHQPLAPRSYQGGQPSISRFDGTEDTVGRMNPTPTPPPNHDGPKSANALKSQITNSTISNATTIVPPRELSASVPPQSSRGGLHRGDSSSHANTSGLSDDDPAVQIFKSFRVALDDPCWKVLPAALRKYNIQADWRQYALYIVHGDNERCVGLEEKPLALFKDLDKEGKKPMFMLRKLANPNGEPTGSAQAGMRPVTQGGVPGGLVSSGASIRTMQDAKVLPGGML